MKELTKREMILIFVIIQFIIVTGLLAAAFILTKVLDTQDIINQISLVSSITSIILALVAIIYAFFQNYSSSQQSGLLHEMLTKINQKIEELVSLKTDVANLRSDLANQLSTVLGGVEDTKEAIEVSGPDDDNKGEIYKKLSLLENTIKDMMIKSVYVEDSQKKEVSLSIKVGVKGNPNFTQTEITEWVTELVININKIFKPAFFGYEDITISKRNFYAKLTHIGNSFLTTQKLYEIKNTLMNVEGERFKVESVTIHK
jgi:hypothetical protein